MKKSVPIFGGEVSGAFGEKVWKTVLFVLLLLVSLVIGGYLADLTAAKISAQTTDKPNQTANEVVSVPETKTVQLDEVSPNSAAPNQIPAALRYALKDSPVRIPRFETAPTIDGNLDDGVWTNAAMFGDFLQTNPGDNVAPLHPTEVMMGYDAKHLYVAFRAAEEPGKVRASVARRDNIFNDDYIGIYLDTFDDQRQAYTFFFNPLGIQADGTFTEGRGEDYNVDLVMESKGVVTEKGYQIEVAIPFKSLRYEAGKNKNWGVHIFRRVKHNNNELDSWMRNDRSVSGSLNQAGHITGLEDISTTRQLEINPSFTLSQSGRRTRYTFDNNADGRYVNDGIKPEFGFNAKFGLTPTTTLDFAYNPDFAQVEADAPVVTANQRFPIFFAERRPFFLERIDIFNTRMNVVNTRAIIDPDIAAKLTGRRGKNTFGLLYASDNAPGNYSKDERQDLSNCRLTQLNNPNVRCANERFVDKNADIAVLRLKRDIGRQHNIGVFATTYNFVDRHNHTAGIDGRFRFNPKTVGEFQLVGTNTRAFFRNSEFDPTFAANDLNKGDARRRNVYRAGNGFGYSYSVERSDRNFYVQFNGVGRTRDFRADVGFTPRTDTNQHRVFARYETERDPTKSIIYKRLFNDSFVSHDWQGRTQQWNSNTQGMLAFQQQIFVGGGFEMGYERVFESEFGAKRGLNRPGAFFGADSERSANRREVYGFVEASPIQQIFALFVLSHSNGQLDFDFGAGPDFPRVSPAFVSYQNCLNNQTTGCAFPALDPGAGKQLFIESILRYQPTSALNLQINYNKSKLTRNDTGRTAFDDNIFSLRSTYQFTRDIFTRLRLDYSTLSTRIRPQLVVGWTPNPGTALYAGYNDDISYRGYNPFTGTAENGFRGNGRTFYIKASYLFRKSF